MRIKNLLLIFFLFTNICFSQTFPINVSGYLELKDMILVGDKIISAGCNTTDRTTPILVCMNFKGDTSWTRSYPELCDNGNFTKLIYFKDSLYAIGYGTNGKYGSDRFSYLINATSDGKMKGKRYVYNGYLNGLTYDNSNIWITGKMEKENIHGMSVYHFDGSLDRIKGRVLTSQTDRRGEYWGNDVVPDDTITWICGACEVEYEENVRNENIKRHEQTFSITRVSSSLEDSIGIFYPIDHNDGECQVICKDKSNYIWVAGKAEKTNDSLGLLVCCYDPEGKKLFSTYHSLSDHMDDAIDILQSDNGDVLIFTMSQGTPEIYVYRETKFYKKVILSNYKDHRIQSMIEYKPNKFIILCLQLAGSFYGKSALIYWEAPK